MKLKSSVLLASIGGIIVLLVIAILVVTFWYRNLTRRDYTLLSSYLHKKVEGRLLELGLGPENLLLEREYPRSLGGTNWLFKETVVSLPPQRSIYQLSIIISDVAKSIGTSARIERYNSDGTLGGNTLVQIGFKEIPFHRLLLVRLDSLPTEQAPKIAIIIDDVGWKRASAERLLLIEEPITLAIIPKVDFSEEIAKLALERGREVLVHLPMEPYPPSVIAPEEGGVTTDMSDEEIRQIVIESIDSLPQAVGLNNHKGSKFTEDEKKMELVLNEVKSKNLYFIDSRTSSQSIGFQVANQLGIKAGSRDVFLDNEAGDIDYTKGQIVEMMEVAKKYGYAIGIGHPHSSTIEALIEMIPQVKNQGIRLVYASELVGRKDDRRLQAVSHGMDSSPNQVLENSKN